MGKKRSRPDGSLSESVMDTANMPPTKKQSLAAPRRTQALPSPLPSPSLQPPSSPDIPRPLNVPSYQPPGISTSTRAVASIGKIARTYEDCVSHWASESSWPREYFDANMPPSRRIVNNEEQPPKFDWVNDGIEDHFLKLKAFMRSHPLGMCSASQGFMHRIQTTPTGVPQNTDFEEPYVLDLVSNLKSRSESDIYRDLTHLLIPEAESHSRRHRARLPHLTHLRSSSNNNWTHCQPIVDTMPKPDYTVGFDTQLLSDEQLEKLDQWFNSSKDNGAFRATRNLFFPFLVCELKTEKVGLTLARRQNLHNSTIILRDLVDLFRAIGRVSQINREILAFSIVHNATDVKLVGHYADTSGPQATYWQVPLVGFDLEYDPQKRWDTYKFIKNIYDLWLPRHLELILGAVDALPVEHENWLQVSAIRPAYTKPRNLGSLPGSSAGGSTSYEGRSIAGSSSVAHSLTET